MTKAEFNTCFHQFFDPIRNFIYYRCGNADLATDVAQEVFMKVWEKGLTYHPKQTKALLYKVAKEMWISQYRKIETAKKYTLSLSLKQDLYSPDKAFEFEELKQAYEKALGQLSEKQREVFLMNRMEQLTYKEIAERLSISVKTVEKRMRLTLQTLRKTLNYERQ